MLAWELAARLAVSCGRDAGTLLDRIVTAGVLALLLTLAGDWLLSLPHLLNAGALTFLGAVAMSAGAVMRRRRALRFGANDQVPHLAFGRSVLDERFIRATLLLAPIVLVTIFLLWRGWILPPTSPDVLSYHLPKAVLMLRNGGYGWFVAPDPRITTFPSNYELLLADILLLSGSDRITEWLSTATFLLFLAAATLLVRRWWGARRLDLAVPLLVATAPVVLLHAGADKNDLLLAVFSLCSAMWTAEWCARGGRAPLILAIGSACAALGTKSHGVIVAGLVGVAIVWTALRDRTRRPSLREAALFLTATCAALLLLGVLPFVVMMLRTGMPIDANVHGAATHAVKATTFDYGAWSQLWEYPLLLWAVPFSTSAEFIWIPWRHAEWLWSRYDLYFSHYGMVVSIVALLLPFGFLMRRRDDPAGSRRERNIATFILLGAAFLIIPTKTRPEGGFLAFPRYMMFILPVIVGWSWGAFARWMDDRGRAVSLEHVLPVLAMLTLWTAVSTMRDDGYAPLPYLERVLSNDDWRRPWPGTYRASVALNDVAGPFDRVAFDSEFDSWIYPAYGLHLTREVDLVPNGAGLRGVPPDANWVVIDRAWQIIWGHPAFRTYGDYRAYASIGFARPDDLLLYSQLLKDRRYRLIYDDRETNQAIFQRVTNANGAHVPHVQVSRPELALRRVTAKPAR